MISMVPNYDAAIGRTLALSGETVNFLTNLLNQPPPVIKSGLRQTWQCYGLAPDETITVTSTNATLGLLVGTNPTRRCPLTIFLNLYFTWPAEELETIAA